MKNGTYYLNNSGHRWVVYNNGKKDRVFAYVNGELIERTVIFYESFGNFAIACISYKGNRRKILHFSGDLRALSCTSHNNIIS